MSAREQHVLFLSNRASRHLTNEPAEITLSRWGEGMKLPETLLPFLEALTDIRINDRARDVIQWAAEHLYQFPYLKKVQLEALRLYTLHEPKYFKAMNEKLYAQDNELSGTEEFTRWAPFIIAFDTGFTEMRKHQRESKHPRPPQLHRIAFMPHKITSDHYETPGHEVVIKGTASCSTEVQRQFFAEGTFYHEDGEEMKKPVILDFDESAVQEAVDLQPVSVFGDQESEWVMPPFFRGIVRKVQAVQGNELFPDVHRAQLGAIRQMPFVAELLEYPDAIEMRRTRDKGLLEFALLLALHEPRDSHNGASVACAAMRDTLEMLEAAIEEAVKDMSAEDALENYKKLVNASEEEAQSAFRAWLGHSSRVTRAFSRVTRAVSSVASSVAISAANAFSRLTGAPPAPAPESPVEVMQAQLERQQTASTLTAMDDSATNILSNLLSVAKVEAPSRADLFKQVCLRLATCCTLNPQCRCPQAHPVPMHVPMHMPMPPCRCGITSPGFMTCLKTRRMSGCSRGCVHC